MKISLFATAFSTIITTSNASSVMDLIGFNMNRGLADMCIDETTDLFIDSSSELTMAYEDVVDEIADRAACNAFLSNCLVDFDTFDTTDGFSSACDMEGGKTIKGSAVIDCQYKDGAMPATPFKVRQAGGNLSGFTLSYYNLVDCVSDTCADDDVVDKISSTLSDTTLMLEEKFNAKCTSFMNYLSGGDVIPVSIGGGDSSTNVFTDNAVLPSLPFTDESSASSPAAEEEEGDSEEGVEDEAVEIKEEGPTSTSPAVHSRGKMTVAIFVAFLTTLVAIA